jgi:hypothetical protein
MDLRSRSTNKKSGKPTGGQPEHKKYELTIISYHTHLAGNLLGLNSKNAILTLTKQKRRFYVPCSKAKRNLC